ncbi:hypothetical protein B0H21DRAFT_889867 [Amylocystis lapponica]|nr:hypothetical protein B0H21DRAFT_889867 [Amylocystis lapponica]
MSSTTICVDASPKPGPSGHTRIPSNTPTHRLLYRGALSLPDSHLLLDGLSFSAKLAPDSSADLLNNPLALALESMRGRPSLHFLGTTPLADIWIDAPGAVSVDVHPHAVLSRIYFESTLCLAPIAPADGRTAHGVRVSLSDSNDPGTTDILIYGQRVPSAAPPTLCLLAARILPVPPPARAPRPDDPTPRHPPSKRKRSPSVPEPREGAKRSRAAAGGAKGKGRAAEDAEAAVRRAREVMLRMPQAKTKAAGAGRSGDVFKVPSVPARARQGEGGPPREDAGGGEMERANKAAVKRAAVRCLAGRGVGKAHAEFNELFQFLYRGTSFALRNTMGAEPVDICAVDTLLDAHAKMYILEGLFRFDRQPMHGPSAEQWSTSLPGAPPARTS